MFAARRVHRPAAICTALAISAFGICKAHAAEQAAGGVAAEPPKASADADKSRQSTEMSLLTRALAIAAHPNPTNQASVAAQLRVDCIAAIRRIQPELPKLSQAAPELKQLQHIPSLLMALGNNSAALTGPSEAGRSAALKNFSVVTNRVNEALAQLATAREQLQKRQ